jgi:hypothetical protein
VTRGELQLCWCRPQASKRAEMSVVGSWSLVGRAWLLCNLVDRNVVGWYLTGKVPLYKGTENL